MITILLDKLGDYFSDINITTILLFCLFLIILFIRFICKNKKDLFGIWNYFYNRQKTQEEAKAQMSKLLELTSEFDKKLNTVSEKVEQDSKRITDLEDRTKDNSNHIHEYEDNRIHDRQQSFEKQHAIDCSFDKVNLSIINLTNILKDMQDKDDEREKARLKNSISRLYRECRKEKKWTCMQKDTMESMIDSYNKSGGNSWVHSIVIPEMYTWEIVDEDD